MTLALVQVACHQGDEPELVMFCAAGLKSPITRIAEQFEQETGIAVRLQFAGSGTLLSNLRIVPGDLYLAADSSYIDEAKTYGLVDSSHLVAHMKAGFGVPVGNPKAIRSLSDLSREGVRTAIGNPEAASVGRFTRKILSQHGAWDKLNPTATFPTVNELANAIKLGTVDAVVIWDAIANQYPEIEFISVPEFDTERKDIKVAVIKSSKRKETALHFCQYLTAGNRGRIVLQEEGYEVPAD